MTKELRCAWWFRSIKETNADQRKCNMFVWQLLGFEWASYSSANLLVIGKAINCITNIDSFIMRNNIFLLLCFAQLQILFLVFIILNPINGVNFIRCACLESLKWVPSLVIVYQ